MQGVCVSLAKAVKLCAFDAGFLRNRLQLAQEVSVGFSVLVWKYKVARLLSGSCSTQSRLAKRASPSKGPSNAFEPADDHPSNLVGTVLLHEVETSDDHVMLIREVVR